MATPSVGPGNVFHGFGTKTEDPAGGAELSPPGRAAESACPYKPDYAPSTSFEGMTACRRAAYGGAPASLWAQWHEAPA